MFRITRDISSVHPDTIISFGGFHIVNTTMTSMLITLFFLFICLYAYRKAKLRPGGVQAGVELLY
jgi:F0F1-type ATP synthase membrane subunit a